jgi:hypothetical protein
VESDLQVKGSATRQTQIHAVTGARKPLDGVFWFTCGYLRESWSHRREAQCQASESEIERIETIHDLPIVCLLKQKFSFRASN